MARAGGAILLLPVVVVYNRECAESASCRGLLAAGARHATVVDNSTRPTGNRSFCAAYGWTYIDMKGNAGLSRAYNSALARLPDRLADAAAERGRPGPAPADVLLLWLDDDTTLPPGFLEAVADAAARHRDADVFLPVVEDAAGILSPCAAGRFRPHRVRRSAFPGDGLLLPAMRFSAINSGMAVRSTVYAGRRYDEGYFLDFLDHDFLRDLRSAGVRFRLLPARLSQAFSDTGPATPASALTRYRVFRKDYRRYQAKRGAAARVFGEAYLLFRAARLSVRHRTTAFLRAAFGRGD